MVEKGGIHTMNIIKKASVITGQDAREMVQPNVTAGYETCQDIPAIKEELARIKAEIDSFNTLALQEKDTINSNNYNDSAQRRAIRYWAIRWVMGWEKEIPNVEM
jgi:hypothetical protein